MKSIDPEFSRTYRLDALGAEAKELNLEADQGERAALARRFGLIALEQLTATAELHSGTHGIDARGTLRAKGTQPCVVTGEPVSFILDEAYTIRFVAAEEPAGDAEIELGLDDLDVMEHDGNRIDLGEAMAQTLGLALDPFPRSTGAEDKLKEAGVLSEGEAGPFAALAALRDKMKS